MLLEGKRGLVLGIANKRSHRLGHRAGGGPRGRAAGRSPIQGERLEENVRELAAALERTRSSCPAT